MPPTPVVVQNAAGPARAARLPSGRISRQLTGGVRGRALRRGDHRRRPQRPRQRRLPGPGRDEDARPGAAPRPRRRGGHRGAVPGLPVQRLLVRRLAAPAGDHPRAPAAAPRARHPAARRDVHARSGTGRGPEGCPGGRRRRDRRLPVARQRPRPDDPRAAPLVGDRRRGVRGIRPAHGRDGPVHQADPGDHPARPDLARPAAAPAARRPAPDVPGSCRSASRPSSSS